MTYLLVTVLGTLPGRVVYILAGKEIAKFESIADIASPKLMLLLTALGLMPWWPTSIMERLDPNRPDLGASCLFEVFDVPPGMVFRSSPACQVPQLPLRREPEEGCGVLSVARHKCKDFLAPVGHS